MSTEVELHIVNAHALEPGKVYLIEIDRAKVGEQQYADIIQQLGRLGVKGIVAKTVGGDGIRVVPVEQEATRG